MSQSQSLLQRFTGAHLARLPTSLTWCDVYAESMTRLWWLGAWDSEPCDMHHEVLKVDASEVSIGNLQQAGAPVISVDVNDGLENQMDPDTWDFEGCGFSALVDLRRETSILLSQSFSALGAVLERTADGAQERLLLYIAADLIGGLAQFIEGSYEISSCIMGCNSRTGGDGIQEPYEQLYQRLEKKVLAFCKLIDASAKDTRSLGIIEVFQTQSAACKQGKTTHLDFKEPGAAATFVSTALTVCSTFSTVLQNLLDIIPDLAGDVRHMPGGFPAWTQKAMIDFLESSEANTVDLQDALFLRPVPWGGWPVPRTSPLCSGLQPPGSNRGSKQFREPTVRAHRKDATGIPTWLGATAKQMLEAIENSGRPIYHSYVAIRNALHFNKEKSCEDSVGLLFDPGLCLENEGGVVYYVNVNPEVKDPLYVRWIGTAKFLAKGGRSAPRGPRVWQEKPVWEAWPDPILAPPHPYDVV
ncbi:Hypothetical protein (Fragment) [Durusdinium trenchii]|uniref:Uncharacterized protein n=1 Tax=Durusdinium trenchii TaxID=1381693 RepID=A0ABP0JWY4_9DINO